MTFIRTRIILFVVFVQISHSFRGIDPKKASLFQGETFSCFGNPEIVFPSSVVNDEYCDCPDGSDEPGTSACEEGQFYCHNKFSLPTIVPSFRVDDGICDCCDGSDEKDGDCPNNCKTLGKQIKKDLKNEINMIAKGIKDKKPFEKKGNDIKNADKKERNYEESINILRGRAETEQTREGLMMLEYIRTLKRIEMNPLNTLSVCVDSQSKDSEDEENLIKDLKFEIYSAYLERKAIEKKIDEIQQLFESENEMFGNLCLIGLRESCFGITKEGNRYALCVLSSITQRKDNIVSLGKFVRVQNNTMYYEKGDQCWNGPQRSTTVHLKCGTKNKVISVSEPSKCEYQMVFETPCACSEETLEEKQMLMKILEQW